MTHLSTPLSVLPSQTATPDSIAPALLPRAQVEGLYVHIPFCFHKCHYCDFYSITRQSPKRMEGLVDLILREAEFWTSAGAGPIPGNPHHLLRRRNAEPASSGRDARLIAGLRERFDLSAVEEWTVEVNPATAAADYCRMLRDSGVDRLSFGAQSFNRDELAMLERHHDPEDVPKSMELARSAGFRRLNVDLIYAIPGQNLESWDRSLRSAIELKTPHISCYNLTYESNTPMAVRKRLGQFTAVEESVELHMFRHTRQTLLNAGLAAYEISNYAIKADACRHNLIYWTGGNYIGLGPSAASHVEGHRWKNRPHLGEWERAVAGGRIAAGDVETLSPARRAGELAMLMLRLSSGIVYSEFADRTDLDAQKVYADQIARFAPAGLLAVDQTAIRLTESGLAVADALSAEFLIPA